MSGNAIVAPGAGVKMEKGRIYMLRGDKAGTSQSFEGVSGVAGLPTISAEGAVTNLYYSGNVRSINISKFTGVYYELNLGVDIGPSVAGHASVSFLENNTYTVGFGFSFGYGASPFYGIDANIQYGTTGTRSPFR